MFNWFKKDRQEPSKPGPRTIEEVREALLSAAGRGQGPTVEALLRQHLPLILANAAAFRTVPEAVAKDPQALKLRVRDTMAVAEILKGMGHPQVLDALVSPSTSNPVERWPRAAADAIRRAETGDRAGSNADLLKLLDEMKPASGPLVDDLRPKVLGTLGVNYFRLGDAAKARQFTKEALRECERTGDAEGVRNYRGNLTAMGGDDEPAAPAPPPRGEADLLRLVLKAQGLCDAGEHVASDAVLRPLLAEAESSGSRGLVAQRGRILGLLGLNAFRRGDLQAARTFTQQARDACARLGDAEGVSVYGANLDAIGREGAPGAASRGTSSDGA